MGFKFWDSWVNSRANTRRKSAKKGQRQAPCLEALEERTLLSADISVTFANDTGPLPTLDVTSYTWGATRPTADGAPTSGRAAVPAPSFQDFTLTLPATDVEPQLWGDLTAGTPFKSATIEVSSDTAVTYTLSDVVITSFTTAGGGTSAPTDTVQLQFGSVAETFGPNAPGDTTNAAGYNQLTQTSTGVGSLHEPDVDATESLGLSFVEGGVTEPELEVQSYSWGATNPTTPESSAAASSPEIQNFSVTLAPTSAEPALWGYLAAGKSLDSATLHVVANVGGNSASYTKFTYTLTDMSITSFTTSADSELPVDTIQLAFRAITETSFPGEPDSNVAEYDQANPAVASAGSVSGKGSDVSDLAILTFVDHGVTENPIVVTSYSWGGTNSTPTGNAGSAVSGNPSLQTFTLTLVPAVAEPGLWGNLAVGAVLDSATIETFNDEDCRYTLTDVSIVSFTTSATDINPTDTIQLAFGKIAESTTQSGSDGSPTITDTAAYDSTTPANDNAGSLAVPAPAGSPLVGVTFVEGGVTEPELPVGSYSWGATNPAAGGSAASTSGASTSQTSLQAFTLTLDAGGAEPALWGHFVAGTHLDSATIHVSKDKDNEIVEYVTYTLTDVTITSFATQGVDRADPVDTIQLTFGTIAESYLPTENDGTLGAANTARYDSATGSADPGSLAAPAPTSATWALMFVDHGVTEYAGQVYFYSWGATNATAAGTGNAGQPGLQTLTLSFQDTSAEPGLWGHLVASRHLDSATFTGTTNQVEYFTYTLTDVTITSFQTSDDLDDSPRDTIQLAFGSIAESYSQVQGGGSAPTDPPAGFDLTGSVAAPAPPSPEVGLTFVDHRVADPALEVEAYSWGATSAAAGGSGHAGNPNLQTFTVTLSPTSAEPGLWGHLVAGTLLDSATIDVHHALSGGSEDFIYTLTDVTINSFTTSYDGDPPIDTVQLDFETVTESYVETGANGSVVDFSTAEYSRAANISGHGNGADGADSDSPSPSVTTTVLSASQTSTTYGQAVVFTALVSPVTPNAAPLAGTVDFFDGTADISGPVTLTTMGGWQEATFTTTALDVLHAPHTITAVYSGSASFAAGTSNAEAVAVSPAPLTITALDQTKVYGASLPTLTASYSGFANGDTTASLTALPTLATTATAASSVGGYSITVGGAADANYTITYVNGTLQVTPAALTVAVNNTTGVYGAPLPAFTVSYSGFVGGDGPSMLSGGLTFCTTATSASTPGYYAVSASGLTDANYQIQYVSGTLTIEANAYQVVPDALDATKSVLVVGGSPHSETIFVAPGSRHGTLALFINGIKHDNIAPATGTTFSRLRIYGGAGNDVLQVSPLLTLTSELYADSGNDVLIGGGGNNILVGGTGHSILIGGAGRNILIGGSAGGDELIGGRGDNLEIAGSTVWDQNTLALDRIMAEWASSDSYATRVANILGDASNPAFGKRQNGPCFLNASTVHSATERDVLIADDSRDLFFAELARSVPKSARDRIVGPTKGDVVEELSTSTT